MRKQTGELRQDIWKQDLHPRNAARARTIPVLEDARDKLLAELNQLDEENKKLQKEIQQRVRTSQEADEEAEGLLEVLEEVLRQWNALPSHEIKTWTTEIVSQRSIDDPNTFF